MISVILNCALLLGIKGGEMRDEMRELDRLVNIHSHMYTMISYFILYLSILNYHLPFYYSMLLYSTVLCLILHCLKCAL